MFERFSTVGRVSPNVGSAPNSSTNTPGSQGILPRTPAQRSPQSSLFPSPSSVPLSVFFPNATNSIPQEDSRSPLDDRVVRQDSLTGKPFGTPTRRWPGGVDEVVTRPLSTLQQTVRKSPLVTALFSVVEGVGLASSLIKIYMRRQEHNSSVNENVKKLQLQVSSMCEKTKITEDGVNDILAAQAKIFHENGNYVIHTVNDAVCRAFLLGELQSRSEKSLEDAGTNDGTDIQLMPRLSKGGKLPEDAELVNLQEWTSFLSEIGVIKKDQVVSDATQMVPFTKVLKLFTQYPGTRFVDFDKIICSDKFASFSRETRLKLFIHQANFHFHDTIERVIEAANQPGQTYTRPTIEDHPKYATSFVEKYKQYASSPDEIKFMSQEFLNYSECLFDLHDAISHWGVEKLDRKGWFVPLVYHEGRADPMFAQYASFISENLDCLLKEMRQKP